MTPPPADTPPPFDKDRLAQMALDYHKTVEGEYGCPGLSCPGVQRLIIFADEVALAAAQGTALELEELRGILTLILAEPYGCPWCDSGKLRNPAKSHGESCGFAKAATMLANKEPRDKRSEQIAEQLAAYAALRQDAQKLVDALSQPPRRDGRRFVSCDLELASLRAALQGTGPT